MIRAEAPHDIDAIHAVHVAAFPSPAEANLVDALRSNGNLLASLVAIDNGTLVGHIALSRVELSGSNLIGAGLAPVAVRPSDQSRGFGSELVRAALQTCGDLGCHYVVLLGDPAYYQRFGFAPASTWKLGNEYGVDEEFMAIELQRGALQDHCGVVRYSREFRDL